MSTVYDRARKFIYLNARPVDLFRWRYHFEGGPAHDVLNALERYQNSDGGFGHALEPDSWNPYSSPIQTWAATEILREIGLADRDHPLIQGILKYLGSGKDFEGKFWFNTVKSNNDYPHAPWWHTQSDSTSHNDYNPTACLAGFILRFTPKDGELHRLGCRIAEEAYKQFMLQERLNDMHTALCYVRLLQYIKGAGERGIIDLSAFEDRLKETVNGLITRDVSLWETSYVCKPSQFIDARDSIFFADNEEIALKECEFIAKTQAEDGSWNIPWSWQSYPEQWAIAKNWWKAGGIVVNMLYLRGLGML